MAGDFSSRIDRLMEEVGTGNLEGTVVVDQVYAKYQHEDLSLIHLGGGHAKYLENPLMANHPDYLRHLADNVLDGNLNQAMADNMEALSREVYKEAPMEFGDLRASGHPMVHSQGEMVYDRAALVGRLTEEEIDIKMHLRSLGLGNIKSSDGFGGLE